MASALFIFPIDLISMGAFGRILERAGFLPGDISYQFYAFDGKMFRIRNLLSFSVSDDDFRGWLVPVPSKKDQQIAVAALFSERTLPDACIVFCGGNAGDLGHRLHTLQKFRALFSQSALISSGYHWEHTYYFDFITFDYRGFGLSHGSPSEKNAYQDLRLCIRSYLEHRYQYTLSNNTAPKIFLYGHSLGASVALDLAADKKSPLFASILGLILDGAPASIFRALDSKTWAAPSTLLSPLDPFPNFKKIPRIQCPVWFCHGLRDPICPITNGLRLHDAAPKHLRSFEPAFWSENASHGDLIDAIDFASRFRRFLYAVLGPIRPPSTFSYMMPATADDAHHNKYSCISKEEEEDLHHDNNNLRSW
eukprot:CAMPEP_0197309318 /NCGR_PEP_ID=MMETSP0891-20130614/7889_1 /TAXON_ID=44058 ORGANISM="Aureoumbra lagunensis, Strain CCMP1510" /NCGR_SAMPLE_ID=MMETSP0891 /ASSEMBLY_ACC=CAM_ASM_000534 /LENGTH=364 /DNA_ID=CAMNT_0042794309 /DNA_START=798 /DNA_END=1892 /DNA_ORIENTATION=-